MSALLIFPLCQCDQSCHPVDAGVSIGREKLAAMSKEKIEKMIRTLFYGLPLVGVVIAGIFSTSERMHQVFILAALLFFQVFILFEVFQPGSNP
jgi:hypothetical protein